jgi:RecJ-like exonuclease
MCGGHFVRMLVPVVTGSVEQVTRSPEIKAATRYVPCPTCGAATMPEFTWCPKCGAALKAYPCPYCGQTASAEDKTCSFCGAPATKR